MERGVEGVDAVGSGENVGVALSRAPSFKCPAAGRGVPGPQIRISMDEVDGGERASLGPGPHGIRGKLPQVAEGAWRDACDFGALSGGGAESRDETC